MIFGASADTPEDLARFKQKFNLPYSFLSDPKGDVAKAFGFALRERSTVVIGKDGNIERYHIKVSPKTHVADVLAKLGQRD